MDYCGSEGYVNYFIFMYQMLWSCLLVYHLYRPPQQLLRSSNNFVWRYNMMICFVSATVGGFMYSVGKANMLFSIGYTYTCSIYPKFHLWLINVPQIAYIIWSTKLMAKIKQNELNSRVHEYYIMVSKLHRKYT